MTIIGPAVGYVLGGQLLQIYTDFMTVDPLTYVRKNFMLFTLSYILYVNFPKALSLSTYRVGSMILCQAKRDMILGLRLM